MTPILSLQNIKKTFHTKTQTKTVFDGLSLDVEPGEFVVIVGGNGAGKSSLLDTVAGRLAVDSGMVQIAGADVTRRSEVERARVISRVFQDPALGTAPRMTVFENLALAKRRGQTRRLKRALRSDLAEQFKELLAPLGLGLAERLETPVEALSGGQRQSIALVMATLTAPKLLLLDEHTAALDPKTAETVLALTDRIITEQHLTALMITHHLKDAIRFGNRLLVLDHGTITHDLRGPDKEQLSELSLYQLMNP